MTSEKCLRFVGTETQWPNNENLYLNYFVILKQLQHFHFGNDNQDELKMGYHWMVKAENYAISWFLNDNVVT